MTTAETLTDLLEGRARRSPHAPAHWMLDARGTWYPRTWSHYHGQVDQLAAALEARGVAARDYVGILAPTSRLWEVAQMAALRLGAGVAGLDPNEADERLAHMVETVAPTVLFVAGRDSFERLSEPARRSVQLVVDLSDASPPDDIDLSWIGVGELMTQAPGRSPVVAGPGPDDVAVIVYTSGTTGAPKPIAFTHRQVCTSAQAILRCFPELEEETTRLACWLPLANLFQRLINFCAVGIGAQTFFLADPRRIMDYIQDMAPHVLLGVPRFYEKVNAAIEQRVAERGRTARLLFGTAAGVGRRYVRARAQGQAAWHLAVANWVAQHTVLRPVVGIFGGRVRYAVTGSAPMPEWLIERFNAMGIPLLEAYGVSENIVPVAVNRPGAVRFGTVGRVLPPNEVSFADDGELLVRGPGVFSGYMDGNGSDDKFTNGGFLRTGDYGEMDADGFIRLHGRKGDVFKTSTGRKIAPATIESCIAAIAYVDHAVVFGAARHWLAAVVAVDTRALDASALDQSRRVPPGRALSAPVLESIAHDVERAVGALPRYQRPAGVLVTTRPFTIEGGELTGNLKVRRASVWAHYRDAIDRLDTLLAQRREGGADTQTVAVEA